MGKLIPFNVPYVPEGSKRYVLEALESNHQQGDGPFTAKASKMVSDLVGGGHVLLTPSCTHALEMASMLANIGPGDEVILPSYTFTSAATAVTKFGATPVFVDVEMDTKGIDVNQVRAAITTKTKAISWVNYAGVAPDIEELQGLGREFNLLLIEDNAHGLGGSYKGKPLGSFGDFATQSFHATKNIQCGEGGALVVNNQSYIARAEVIREKGTDRSKFMRGEVQKYQWVDKGSSYLLAETLAAVLLGQLNSFQDIQTKRQKLFDRYIDQLDSWANESKFQLPFLRTGDLHTAHMYYMVTSSSKEREFLIQSLSNVGIAATFHYQSLGHSIQGARYLKGEVPLKASDELSRRLIRLPLYTQMSEDNQDLVISRLSQMRPKQQ
jgi:dTDP-4-amino-4,6-dideoxygalactose transaminase